MRDVLAGEEALDRMPSKPPPLRWTFRPIPSAWAYWTKTTSGKAAGKAVIRLNLALQAPRSVVSDELLEYLVFHELLHDLLPGQGHDAEFRRLEGLWPGADTLDYQLDALQERYTLRTPRK